MFALTRQLWKEQNNLPQPRNYQKIIIRKKIHRDMI
jgi:hypothetical protein